MANTDVTITSPSATKSKADVGSITVSKNDTITWINATSDVMIVFFPHDKLGNSQNHFFRSIQPGDSDTIKVTTSKMRAYRYGVFCHDTNSFATGSDLEIIVQ
jgi:hypothetical protein